MRSLGISALQGGEVQLGMAASNSAGVPVRSAALIESSHRCAFKWSSAGRGLANREPRSLLQA